MAEEERFHCQICGDLKKERDLIPAGSVQSSITDMITKNHPAWSSDGYICQGDLNRFRLNYARDILGREKNEYASLQGADKEGIETGDHLPKNVNIDFLTNLTFGDRLADKIAGFAGSWTFVAIFFGVIFFWVSMNTFILLSRAFDPYPYILLNLVLSILAAIQAPIIIMSQNRQEMRDRLHAERDYEVSIHTDQEIHRLHKKIDYLMKSQGQRLPEIQNIQMELMADLVCLQGKSEPA
ncbi:MAG TPA: DUF1003 domain-containing protein [Methanoregulaceae archaeon]|nr:DUF1003 domain-containing protein [Methanoregulaceae archaeon]